MKANLAWLLSFLVMAGLAAARKPDLSVPNDSLERKYTFYRPPDLPIPMPYYTSRLRGSGVVLWEKSDPMLRV